MTTALFFITLQQMLRKVKWSVWVHRTLWQFMNSNIKYEFCRIIYIYLLIFCFIGGGGEWGFREVESLASQLTIRSNTVS